MKAYSYKKYCLLVVSSICFVFGSLVPLKGQDPFFSHFYNNRSHFNPALTGISGSLSLQAKHKSQWKGTEVPAFVSTAISLEETVLCHFLDYGFFFNYDKEGAGIFETFEPGFRIAGTIPFGEQFNVRLGASMQWGWKRIDYTKLIFSDQLDPRYGFQDLPSSFIPPNEGASKSYISPGVGGAIRGIINPRGRVVVDLMGGIAMHNGFALGNDNFGHTESILGLDAEIPLRWNVFLDTDFYFLGNGGRSFFSISPQALYQRQASLNYLEIGARFGFNRLIALGFHFHQSTTNIEDSPNSNWFSISGEFGGLLGKERRIDLGFSYSSNIEGLRNIVGPIWEISLTYHFRSSPACSLFGGGDPSRSVICPPLAKTRRNKIYDNIWYQN